MSTNAPAQAPVPAYAGRYRVVDGPEASVAVDSLKYRRNRIISVPVTFMLIDGRGNKFKHTGQISGFNYGIHVDGNIADIAFDGPGGQLRGWFSFEAREGVFHARS